MKYAKIALGLPINKLFDYRLPELPNFSDVIGRRVVVTFAGRNRIGYVVGTSSTTKISGVKPILKIIDSLSILKADLLALTEITANYYASPRGQIIEAALPLEIRKGKPVDIKQRVINQSKESKFRADLVCYNDKNDSFEHCLREIQKVIACGEAVIVLVNEINRAIEIYNILKQKYERIALSYRRLNSKEELEIWQNTINGVYDIVIGTRPLAFAPLNNLGLIIVLDEDLYGYKEEQAPYYNGAHVALLRAKLQGIPIIFTTQAPRLESYYALRCKQYNLINYQTQNNPGIKILSAFFSKKEHINKIISLQLQQKINSAINLGKRVLIIINKKGFARRAFCKKCGATLSCNKCSTNLLYDSQNKLLICRSCGFRSNLLICPLCQSSDIKFSGSGIQKVISDLNLLFPQAKISLIDKDHTQLPDDSQIIAATEKIFHLSSQIKTAIVIILDLDSLINVTGFRSNEKVFSIVHKLKALAEEELIIQTTIGDYYLSKKIDKYSLEKLYDEELKERKKLKLPPYYHLAHINLRSKNAESLKKKAQFMYYALKNRSKKVFVNEVQEAIPFKLRGNYRYTIILKAKAPESIGSFIRKHLQKNRPSGIIVTVEMDPQ